MNDGSAILRSLTQTTIDSAQGYGRAAENATSQQLKNVLNEAAARRLRVVADLNEELVRLGEEPQKDGSTMGSLHHAWTRISDAFTSGDKAAADRVEEGEDYIRGKFEEALANTDLQPQTRDAIQRALSQIREGERLADQLDAQYG
jgi:uncharacterized protein (TIGR02284 family)